MSNDKLLRAFIEAQSYEIKEIGGVTPARRKELEDNNMLFTLALEDVIDYKVTKNGKDNRLMGEGSKTLSNRLKVSVKTNKDLMAKNRKLQQLLCLHLKDNGFNYTQIANELSVTPTVVKGYFRKAVRGLEKEFRNENI